MAPPMTPAAVFDNDRETTTTSAPSSTTASSVHLRMAMDFNRGSNPFGPPSPPKRPRRAVRKIQTRVRPRGPLSGYEPAPQIILAAANTDTKLETLSDEVKAMQDEARTTVYENFSQQVDNDSLKDLEKANMAKHDFDTRLDNLSKAVIKSATEPMQEPELNDDDLDGEIVDDSNRDEEDNYCKCLSCRLNEQPIFFTLGRAGRLENGTESYCIVDSTPSLNSDDVFGAAIPRSMPTPQMQLVMPVLTFGNTSGDNTKSSGRPLAPISDESTLSSRSPTPPVNTPAESVSSMSAGIVQPKTLAMRLEEVNKEKSKEARSQAWLANLIAKEIGEDAKEPLSNSWLEDQIAAAMAEEVEAIDDDDEFFDDDEDWVVIDEDAADMEDWFEVASETMVKSTT